jgi:hypothetical protein
MTRWSHFTTAYNVTGSQERQSTKHDIVFDSNGRNDQHTLAIAFARDDVRVKSHTNAKYNAVANLNQWAVENSATRSPVHK